MICSQSCSKNGGGTSTIVTPPVDSPELPELSYSLPRNSDSASVPRFYTYGQTARFFCPTPNTKKKKFTQIVLPLILYENERIRRQNEEIRQAYESADRDILDEYAHIYKLKNVEELSIDTVYQLVMRVQQYLSALHFLRRQLNQAGVITLCPLKAMPCSASGCLTRDLV